MRVKIFKAIISICGMATLALPCGVFYAQASALTAQSSVGVQFTFNDALNVTMSSADLIIDDLTPGNFADSNEITVSVGTNTAFGYELYATAGNSNYDGSSNFNANDLVLTNGGAVDTDQTNIFTSLETTDSYSAMSSAADDTWGFAYATYNTSGSAWNSYSNYSGLPVYTADGVELINTRSTADSQSIKFKIAAKASNTKTGGEYTNVVNFIAIAKPVPGSTPLNASDCPANRICYAPNATDVIGTMATLGTNTALTEVSPLAGIQTQTVNSGGSSTTVTSNSTAQLIAPNYKRAGYGFAGWSTDFTATSTSTIYGPNETINTGDLSTNGMILYPVWVAVQSGVTMQTWSSSNCTALTQAPASGTATLASLTAVKDARDDNIYTIARLADGQCWMVENLRMNDTTELSISDTHNPLNNGTTVTLKNNYSAGTITNHLAATNDSWCTSNSAACDDQTMLNTNNTNATIMGGTGTNASSTALTNTPGYPIHTSSAGQNGTTFSWYSYGNYYNWYSATAGNGTYSKSSGNVSGDLCPTGWHLPYGSNGTAAGGGNTAGGFYYLNYILNNNSNVTNSAASMNLRKFPNNFVYSGYWYGSSASDRGSYGLYWSSSAYNSNYAYNLGFYSTGVYPGTYNYYKNLGFSVRCVAGS